MKIKNLLIALFVITTLFTSCKKDDNTRPQNYLTFDGKTTELTAGTVFDGDVVYIYLNAEKDNFDENFVVIAFPKEKFGKLQQLHRNYSSTEENYPTYLVYIDSNGEDHVINRPTGEYHDHQWVKVKYNGDNNYTVEFSVKFDEKLLIGTYTGPLSADEPS